MEEEKKIEKKTKEIITNLSKKELPEYNTPAGKGSNEEE